MDYAHSLEGRPKAEWESLEAHSARVAHAARVRAEPFGGGPAAEVLGLLHDLGKAKPAFQRRLEGVGEVSHAGEGARAMAGLSPFGTVLAGAIAGHHGALPGPVRLRERIAQAEAVALPGWCAVGPPPWPGHLMAEPKGALAYRTQFLVRVLYGCLTDADDRETGDFYAEAEGRAASARPAVLTETMRAAFNAHMAGMGGEGPVNDLRREVLAHARGMAQAAPGLFTMTVPTGVARRSRHWASRLTMRSGTGCGDLFTWRPTRRSWSRRRTCSEACWARARCSSTTRRRIGPARTRPKRSSGRWRARAGTCRWS